MRLLSRWRARALLDFADALRPELAELPVPAIGDDVLARIQHSRAIGQRVILPHVEVPHSGRAGRWIVAAAVIGAMLFMTRDWLRPRAESFASAPSWFAGVANAQVADVASGPVRIAHPERMHPMRLRYVVTAPGGLRGASTLTVRSDSAAGAPAWQLVYDRAAGADFSARSVDTVRLRTSDLSLL
ncbi:MAG TPA: hypothetical protein VE967_04745, partial [Gemmatimonadaceae bacterium]|nr:hypothetical protein [Gemmatimonadaceae bacterium]